MQQHRLLINQQVTTNLFRCVVKCVADFSPCPLAVLHGAIGYQGSIRVTLKPDDKAQNWLLNISTSDKLDLLYSVARVLARHQVDVLLAKVATLGERVEDSFLLRGAALQHNKAQIAMETELL